MPTPLSLLLHPLFARYIYKSLLIRFDTLDDLGDHRRLLLNLRKGYFKHGELLGTKIYLSQVQEVESSTRVEPVSSLL